MTLKQYEAVFYAVNTKTLTKAGEKLKTSQTAVSHLIADLEKELGFKIINRGKNGVTLTTEGGRLFPFIQEVVFANERAVNYAKKLKSENEVTINVGTFSSVAVNWLPAIIKEFNTFHPEVHFNIIDGGYGDILKALYSGVADVGFISTTEDFAPDTYPLVTDRILAVLPVGHKFANAENFNVKNFENETIISLNESTDFDSRRIFEKSGITPNIRYRTADDYAMISMVENNLGICLMPELLLGKRTLNVVTLELNPPEHRVIALKVANENSKIVNEFKNHVLAWVKRNVSSK
jgi:DNA-binding transcriptional LysR family regulator